MIKHNLLVMTNFLRLQNVMLVDDDDISLYLTERRLKKDGFTENIIKCTSVDDAIAYLFTNQYNLDLLPDLIFLDINMPKKDGWDFLNEYKAIELSYRAPVVMLSSSDSLIDKIKSTNYPGCVFGFFNKPLKVEDTMALISFINDKQILKE
jgi:CheY-like chemotaxis protein